MEGLDVYVNPMFWVSLLVGGIALAAISYGFQMAQDEGQSQTKELNVKGLVRDTILGGIFTAMAWTFVPEFMSSITNSATSAASTVTTAVSSTTSSLGSSLGSTVGKTVDVDVQVGPARF